MQIRLFGKPAWRIGSHYLKCRNLLESSISKLRHLFHFKTDKNMKKTILLLGVLVLIVNVLFGLLLSKYSYFNMGVNCGVIALNTALLFCLYQFNIRDAFRISLSFLFVIVGLVEMILGCLMQQHLQDNACLIAILILLFAEVSLFVIVNILSNKIK